MPKREVTKRRLARWQRERRRRRIAILVGALVIAVVVAIIGYGYYATRIAPPRQLLSTVNGTSIRASDYVTALRFYSAPQDSASQIEPEMLLSTLESNELIRQGAAAFGISVSDEEVEQQIRDFLETPDEPQSEEELAELYQQILDYLGVSDTEFREAVAVDLLRSKVDSYLREQVPEEALQVHVLGILVATEEEAQDVVARLEAGEPFAIVAQDVSVDPVSRPKGGDLGWIPEGLKGRDFDDVAFTLEPLTLSQPFSTQQGYWVIEVLEKEEREIDQDVRDQLKAVAFSNWLAEQREEKVERKVDANELEEVHEWALGQIG